MQLEPGHVGDAMAARAAGADLLALGALITGMECVLAAEVTPTAWRAVAVHGQCSLAVAVGTTLEPTLTFCNEVRRRGEAVYCSNAGHEQRFRDSALAQVHGIHSHVAVPLRTRGGRLFGTLCAFDSQPRPITAEMLEGMNRLARLYGALLDDASDRIAASADLTDSQLQLARSRHALEESRQQLLDFQAVAKLREEFIAVLAHDLRNPLQAIRMVAEMFGMASLTSAQERLVARMDQSVERMSELIDTTLDFARGRLGAGLELDLQPCTELEAYLAGIVAEVRLGHPERRILSVLEIAQPVPCDQARIGQMLGNLMINAIVHGSAGSAIQVMAESTTDEFRLSVANRGAIPSDKVDRIFEPFERAEDRRAQPGLGLGLYIASQIAAAHGGTLKVFSAEDAGTIFEFTLPLVTTQAKGDSQRT